jgi:hypothetical protein
MKKKRNRKPKPVELGRDCLHVHGSAWIRLTIDRRPPGYDGYTMEWVRAEIIGVEDGHLVCMLAEEPVVPHGYRQGQVLPVQFEQLGPQQSAIWLVPREAERSAG